MLNGNLHSNGQIDIPLLQNNNYTTLTILFDNNITSILLDSNDTKWKIDQNLFNDYIFIGSILDSIDQHKISTPNFYGCIKLLKINDQLLRENLIVGQYGIMQTCPLHKEPSCLQSNAQKACQRGRCVNSWEGYYCLCDDGFEAIDCQLENSSVSSAGATIHLQPSLYSRQKLTSNNKQLVHEIDEKVFYSTHHNFSQHDELNEERIDNWPSQWIEFDIRTGHKNFTILKVKSKNGNNAKLSVMNGELIYSVIDANGYSVASLQLNASNISDRKWHRLTIEIASDVRSVVI